MKALCEASPQARHHFTRFDQGRPACRGPALKRTPILGFMARMMALCSLPRSNPGTPASVQARQRTVQARS